MAKQVILTQKPAILTNGKLFTDQPLLDRGMNLEEYRAICPSPEIPVREKLFFRIIYKTQLRHFEALKTPSVETCLHTNFLIVILFYELNLSFVCFILYG